jgi:hypothetical protein
MRIDSPHPLGMPRQGRFSEPRFGVSTTWPRLKPWSPEARDLLSRTEHRPRPSVRPARELIHTRGADYAHAVQRTEGTIANPTSFRPLQSALARPEGRA